MQESLCTIGQDHLITVDGPRMSTSIIPELHNTAIIVHQVGLFLNFPVDKSSSFSNTLYKLWERKFTARCKYLPIQVVIHVKLTVQTVFSPLACREGSFVLHWNSWSVLISSLTFCMDISQTQWISLEFKVSSCFTPMAPGLFVKSPFWCLVWNSMENLLFCSSHFLVIVIIWYNLTYLSFSYSSVQFPSLLVMWPLAPADTYCLACMGII